MSKESAEEKLLKMMQKSASPVAGKSPSSLAKKFKFALSITTLNTFLFLGIIVCIMALVYEMRSGFSLLNQPVEFSGEPKTDISSESVLPSIPGSDHYLKQINERDIFKPYVAKSSKLAAIEGLGQQMSKYRLVGIAWLDLPETASVMIEDKEKHKIYFLKQGEQLEGVTVKAIYTDRAVFSHENEETTIKL